MEATKAIMPQGHCPGALNILTGVQADGQVLISFPSRPLLRRQFDYTYCTPIHLSKPDFTEATKAVMPQDHCLGALDVFKTNTKTDRWLYIVD